MLRALTLAVGALLLSSCATTPVSSSSSSSMPLWTVRLLPGGDVDVGGLDVTVCNTGGAARLEPDFASATSWLMDVPVAVDARGAAIGALPFDERGIDIRGLPAGACVNFIVDVESAARAIDRRDVAQIVGRSVLLSPDLWLWRPTTPSIRAGRLMIDRVEGDVDDDDLRLVVPFPRDDKTGAYELRPSTWQLQSWSAVGRLRPEVIAHGPTRVVVTRLADGGLDDATLHRWMHVAIDDVAAVNGRFTGDVAVFVVPGAGERAILGGFLGRGGGVSAIFHLGTEVVVDDGDDVDDDHGRWVLTHELAHTLLPPVHHDDGWFNEGFATWLQERLPVKSGRRAVDVAEREIATGLRTGRARAEADGLSLEVACAQMHARKSYQHCYWGGVALLELLVDDVGVDGVFDLIAAIPADATPHHALVLLQAVSSSSSPSSSERAKQAALRLQALWQQYRHAPFPDAGARDVVDWNGAEIETPTEPPPTSSPLLQ